MGDRLEQIEHEMYCIGEAIDFLNEVTGCIDMIEVLLDKQKVLAVRKDEALKRLQALDAREERALTAEYWRSAI